MDFDIYKADTIGVFIEVEIKRKNLKSLIALIFALVLLNSCDYRTPSKDRFEKVTKIELSGSIKVSEDRFETAGSDYGLIYKFGLNESECLDFKSKIKESQGWIKKDTVWTFYKIVDDTIYNITFSEQECEVTYNEDLI